MNAWPSRGTKLGTTCDVVGLVLLLAPGCGSRPRTEAPRDVSLKPLWSLETGTAAHPESSPAVMPDGTVVAAGSQGEPRQPCLHVITPAGEILQTVVGGTPFEMGDARVWVSGTSWGAAYAVDAAGGFYAVFPDGRARYRGDQAGTRFAGPPVIGGDGVAYVPFSSGVRALQFEAIESPVKWELNLRHAATTIVTADGTLRVVDAVAIHAIDPDGTSLWTRRRGSHAVAADSEGTLYGIRSQTLRAVTSEAEPKWEYEFETKIVGGPVVGAGVVYVTTEDGLLNAVQHTGKPSWSYKLPARGVGAPVVGTDGTIYMGLVTGALVAVGDDGNPRWSVKLGKSLATPALGGDGTIYVESVDRMLHAVVPPPRG